MNRQSGRMLAGTAMLILTALGVVAALSVSRAGPQEPRSRSEYMRQKLEFSKNVLEGLSLEQYPMIEKNAKALRRLSQAAEWEVPMIPNATDYVALTSEFQRYAEDLARCAKQGNIDGATLAYVKLTMNCVQCHKYVRFASK
jgi:cytochrome c556